MFWTTAPIPPCPPAPGASRAPYLADLMRYERARTHYDQAQNVKVALALLVALAWTGAGVFLVIHCAPQIAHLFTR